MLYLIYLVVLIALIVIAWALIAAVGVMLFYVMMAIILGTVLIAHGRSYFSEKHPGVSKPLLYVPVLGVLIFSTVMLVPGARVVANGMAASVEALLALPWFSKYAMGVYALAALYFSLGLRKIDDHTIHPYYSGAAYIDQFKIAFRAIPSIWEAIKRAVPWMFTHWIGILAGLVAGVFGIPAAFALLGIGVAAAVAGVILWGAVMAIPTLLLMGIFRTRWKVGTEVRCPKCKFTHIMPGPGPWGLFSIRCACENEISIWEAGSQTSNRSQRLPWFKRERNPGTQSLLSISLFLLAIGYFTPAITRALLAPSPVVAAPAPTLAPAAAIRPKAPNRKGHVSKGDDNKSPDGGPAGKGQAAPDKQKGSTPPEKNPFDIQE